ncbi:ATP-binding protein [Streptomyces sp. NPDC102274]|uniref:ATP-binding protein n=1 Tax=Streptomyces sp. NPDC102274 TaxID=3366151 RepID=UPI003807F566
MTPIKTADTTGGQVPPARVPLRDDVENALINEPKNHACGQEGRPLVPAGDSGTGKSHLLIGAGAAIAEAGLTVRDTTTSALVNELAGADPVRRMSRVIGRYSKADLLCPDEFGYLNLDQKDAKPLFRIPTEREERRATAVASRSRLSKWDKTFTDARLRAVIADRLTLKATLIQTGADSYRLKATETEHQVTRRR